jgi:hypothetical protein
VPTCVAQTSNGTIYVGDLNGRLWEYTGSFTPQQVTLSGDPVSSIESCATDGTDLFVTDIFAGNIDRIARSGAVQTLTTGLNFPGGVTVGPNNTLYFTNNSTFADSGEVLKLAL